MAANPRWVKAPHPTSNRETAVCAKIAVRGTPRLKSQSASRCSDGSSDEAA